MKNMPIVWYRLVKAGETCVRCGQTHQELEKAVDKLKSALLPLGIEITFETKEIGESEFKDNPSKSNEVWMAGKLVEEWLDAKVGMTPCSSVCEGSSCRTIKIGDNSYETIPEELFVRAGLRAASEIMLAATEPCSSSKPCCGGTCS